MNFSTLFLSLLQFLDPQPAPATPEILSAGFIYESAPFPQCHASTLVETQSGIMAAWFGGTHEKHPDVSIYTSELKKGAWSTPKLVADGVKSDELRYPTWNPVLYQLDKKELALFYKVGPHPREWWGVYKTSRDEGKTWSEEKAIPNNLLGPIKNKTVELADGTLLHPTSFETTEKWNTYIETSDASLKNWKKIDIDNAGFNAIQPTVLFHPDGKLQLLCRTKENVISTTWSSDQGKTWSKMEATSLVNNNSGIDAVTLKSGYHLLVCNPIKKGRNKISLFGSTDGINWEELLVLEDESEGEFSYPAIIQAKDGTVHISYTYNRVKVKHVQVKV
jgi:predicted neuraminidase